MSEQSIFRRFGDRVARRLWSGEVVESDERTEGSAPSRPVVRGTGFGESESGWSRTNAGVAASKARSEKDKRQGRVPEHIASPKKGRERSFNPFGLRRLARSESVQVAMQALMGDLESSSWRIVPVDEDASPSRTLIEEATSALRDLNPNPESFDDVNQMFARELLTVGNCAGVTNMNIQGRRAEVVPYDAATFTVDWDEHRVLDGFYQYPHESTSAGEMVVASGSWGDPIPFDGGDVLWGIYNPTIGRGGFYGRSPVEMVARQINVMGGLLEKETTELEEGMPSGMISLVGDGWSDDNYKNFKSYWRNEVKGSQAKHPVAEGRAEFVPFDMSYQELQILDRQRWYSKLVSAAFRIPITETGLAVGSETTRATSVAQHQRYKKRALGGMLSLLEGLWTTQYLHRWFGTDIRLKFETEVDLMEQRERAEVNRIRLRNGTRSINEVREEQGLEPVDWGDEPFRPYSGVVSDEEEGDRESNEPTGGSRIGGDEKPGALREGLQQNATPTQSGGKNPLSQKRFDGVDPSIIEGVREWASEPTERMREVAAEQGAPIGEVLLRAEMGEESRTESHQRLGVSRPTYYKWLRKAGLYEQ
jgi:hypothetical protein